MFSFPDTSLKDGLFHEFKKYGKVTSVQIHGASEERYGLVFFRQQEDQEKALSVSKGKLFFGMLIEVTAWNGPGECCSSGFCSFAAWRSSLTLSLLYQKQKARMSFDRWTDGSTSFTQRQPELCLLEIWRKQLTTSSCLMFFSALGR